MNKLDAFKDEFSTFWFYNGSEFLMLICLICLIIFFILTVNYPMHTIIYYGLGIIGVLPLVLLAGCIVLIFIGTPIYLLTKPLCLVIKFLITSNKENTH